MIAAALPPQAAQAYNFAGVVMGGDLAAFSAARPMGRCDRADSKGFVVCHAPDQPLGGGYFARDLTYRYWKSHLVQIAFHTSIDGFSFVMAKLKQDFGAPAKEQNDTASIAGHAFPHVAYAWRNGRSTIRLSDPASANQLAVRITLDAAQAPLQGIG